MIWLVGWSGSLAVAVAVVLLRPACVADERPLSAAASSRVVVYAALDLLLLLVLVVACLPPARDAARSLRLINNNKTNQLILTNLSSISTSTEYITFSFLSFLFAIPIVFFFSVDDDGRYELISLSLSLSLPFFFFSKCPSFLLITSLILYLTRL